MGVTTLTRLIVFFHGRENRLSFGYRGKDEQRKPKEDNWRESGVTQKFKPPAGGEGTLGVGAGREPMLLNPDQFYNWGGGIVHHVLSLDGCHYNMPASTS
jgi:hypothetical protein